MSANGLTIVERFTAEHIDYHGLTDERRRMMLRQLAALQAHAGCPPEQVNDEQLRAFLGDQVAAGLHVNTVRKHNHALRPFFRWAWRTGIVDADRWMRLDEVPDPRGSSNSGRPRPYKPAQVAAFWVALDERFPLAPAERLRRYQAGRAKYGRVWRHAFHLQIRAVACLALFHGLRRNEIRRIDIDDMHPDNEFIVVRHGKSRTSEAGYREVPYVPEGRRYVAEWLGFRALMKPRHQRPWLVLHPNATPHAADPRLRSRPNHPMRDEAFKGLIGRVGPGWELHRLRHTCATEWLRAGVDLELVSKLLGHASIQQTLVYAELVRDDVARGMRVSEDDFLKAVGRRARQVGTLPL